MNLDIGILVIGSLFWDNHIRSNWRQERLSLEDRYNVKVPICYGRCSEGRNNTYTMVFSRLCLSHDLGVGKAILCKSKVNMNEDIIKESKYLWAAENNIEKLKNRISAPWGSVGLMINPKLKQKSSILSSWKDFYESKNNFHPNKAINEKPVINNGSLNIPWPCIENSNENLPFDLLLTTVNEPSLVNQTYPTAKEIANAWINDPKGNINYFQKNIENGIKTYQDKLINNYLEKLK
jgi:hypothetical protein